MHTKEQIHEIRMGFYSAAYFNKTRQIMKKFKDDREVVMQVFSRAKEPAYVYGIKEVLEILKNCAGFYAMNEEGLRRATNGLALGSIESLRELERMWVPANLEVETLPDGAATSPDLPVVMKIRGRYSDFAHLESVYLGILARSSRVYTNVRALDRAIKDQTRPLYFFADRFDRFENQKADGEAALMAGADIIATDAMGFFLERKGSGSMPHALIAANNGYTARAAMRFHQTFPEEKIIVLVDYHNDCLSDIKKVIDRFVEEDLLDTLWGFRLDTSGSLVDASLPPTDEFKGVNPALVQKVSEEIRWSSVELKIMVTGGLTPERIALFEDSQGGRPDAYGVGSWILNHNPIQFTADIVSVGGEVQHKYGRPEKHFAVAEKAYKVSICGS